MLCMGLQVAWPLEFSALLKVGGDLGRIIWIDVTAKRIEHVVFTGNIHANMRILINNNVNCALCRKIETKWYIFGK